MKNLVIADTGFWYALINERDRFHRLAVTTLQNLDATLISTCPVVTETSYLLQSRIGQKAACEFLNLHSQGFYEMYRLRVGNYRVLFEKEDCLKIIDVLTRNKVYRRK
jgi:predicted nucleic acid-binding protein